MARIDWALLCDSAFLDRQHRLCVIGVMHRLPAPAFPVVMRQVMIVAHLAGIAAVDELDLAFAFVTPSGALAAPREAGCVSIEIAGGYLLGTLRDLPLQEAGLHRFQIGLGGNVAASLDLEVWAGTAYPSATVN